MVKTQYFKVKAGRYVKACMLIWLGSWWWTIAVPMGAFLAAGLADSRFYIVSLALLLMVYPWVLMTVYFNHALSPAGATAVIDHRVSVDAHGLTVSFLKSADYKTPADRHYASTDIKEVEDVGDAVIVYFATSKYDFIEVPATAFAPGDMAKFLRKLNDWTLAQNLHSQ